MTFKKFLMLLSVIFLAQAAFAAETREQLSGLLNEANQTFRQANGTGDDAARNKLYEKAILGFEKIVTDGGVKNAGLYYNIANAYLLKGDIGKAIVNYRRGEKLDNADTNIKKNLAFARSRRVDDVKIKTDQRVLQTLFFWHYDFSIKTRFLLACVFFAGLCISITIAIWAGRNAPCTTIAVIAGVLTICFLASVFIEANMQANKICGVITAGEVVARQGDGQNYPTSFKDPLHAGTEFDVLEIRPGWLHIKLADSSDGWIPDNSADLI
jgi:hypothetical protein